MTSSLDPALRTRRVVLPEIEDLPCCPPLLRTCATDYLRAVADVFPIFDCAADALRSIKTLPRSFAALDLCSGSGGPWVSVSKRLAASGLTPSVTLSDLFVPAAEKLSLPENIRYRPMPTDAASFPPMEVDVVTMFNAFHHLSTDDAEGLLARAASQGLSLAIFEVTERNVWSLLMVLLAPLLALLTGVTVRPFRWDRFLLTYLVPVVPAFALADGVLSVLRSYTARELRDCTDRLRRDGYQWTVGRCRSRWYLPSVLNVIGHRAAR